MRGRRGEAGGKLGPAAEAGSQSKSSAAIGVENRPEERRGEERDDQNRRRITVAGGGGTTATATATGGDFWLGNCTDTGCTLAALFREGKGVRAAYESEKRRSEVGRLGLLK
ncbi:hypothetical protein ACJRO7_008930 [Eucalyptus globulus]|uniref:Uncharacterized protein n=1 Tax=Eucalyptus globulus TaxID=34317 RepID=A0ABD3ITA7_EUCGL